MDRITRYHSNAIAVLSGLVFLLHPIQTEGVVYIVQRATSLASLFYLCSLCFYIKALQKNTINARWGILSIYYIVSFLIAFVGMFTKEMVISLPFIVWLYSSYFVKGRNKFLYIPFLFLLFVIPVTMVNTQSLDFTSMGRVAEDTVRIGWYDYFLTQFRVILTYIRLLFIPISQNLDYDYPIIKSLFDPQEILSILVIALILIITMRLGRSFKLACFGIYWFFITLLPESGLVPISDVIFEHRLYLPMVGFSVFFVILLYYLLERYKKMLIFSFILIFFICSGLTYKRNFIWKDDITLWTDVISKSPGKARGYINRGLAYQVIGRLDKAFQDYNKASEIYPFHAGTHSNIGMIYLARGEIDKAIKEFNTALSIDSTLAGVYYNMGYAYELKGDFDQAILHYNSALIIQPDYPDAYNNRGNVYLKKGDIKKAVRDYKKALQIDPFYEPAYKNLRMIQ